MIRTPRAGRLQDRRPAPTEAYAGFTGAQPAATVPENAPGRDLVPNAFEQDPGIGGGYRPMTADANPTHSCTLQKRVPLSEAGRGTRGDDAARNSNQVTHDPFPRPLR